MVEPVGGEADGAGDRRVERVPDEVAQLDRRAAPARMSPGGGISTCSRARNTDRAEHAADRLREARGGVLRRRAGVGIAAVPGRRAPQLVGGEPVDREGRERAREQP